MQYIAYLDFSQVNSSGYEEPSVVANLKVSALIFVIFPFNMQTCMEFVETFIFIFYTLRIYI